MYAELAVDYYQLRGLDEQKRILDASIANYEEALNLTQAQFDLGLVSGLDVAEGDWLALDSDLRSASAASGVSQYELLTSLGHRFERRWK